MLVDTKSAKPPITAQPESAAAQPRASSDKDAGPTAETESKGSVAIAINPAIGKKFGTGNGKPAATETTPGLPPGEHPRMINSQRFELEYDVDSVGPSGIGRVELWGTRDGGHTWRSYTTTSDGRSPLAVSVPEDGIYGFRVVVTNGAGVGGKPPVDGDLPDLWVGVDMSKPTARIISAQQGVAAEADQLIISWQADDNMLAARPVSLSFSQTRSGPWLPIASGLENTGRYGWRIDSRTPPQLYLRLEVRDEAGNVGVYETAEPVAIDQSHPTVRVRDVRPVGTELRIGITGRWTAQPLFESAFRLCSFPRPSPPAPRPLILAAWPESPLLLSITSPSGKHPPRPVCAVVRRRSVSAPAGDPLPAGGRAGRRRRRVFVDHVRGPRHARSATCMKCCRPWPCSAAASGWPWSRTPTFRHPLSDRNWKIM